MNTSGKSGGNTQDSNMLLAYMMSKDGGKDKKSGGKVL